jgi:hypothetical protein
MFSAGGPATQAPGPIAGTVKGGPDADGLILVGWIADATADADVADGYERVQWVSEGGYVPAVGDDALMLLSASGDPWALVSTPAGVRTPVAVMREAPLNVDDSRVGGDLATAIGMLPSVGGARRSGEIAIPSGRTLQVSTLLDLSDTGGVTIRGMGGNPGWPIVAWTGGAGSGPMIRFDSAFGLRLEGLTLGYTNAAYDGDLLTCDHSAAGLDSSHFHMERCYLGGLGGAIGAASLLKPNKLIISTIRACTFQNAHVGIRRGADYVTTLTIDGRTEFSALTTMAIRDPDNCWTIRDCVFEPLTSGAPGAMDQTLVGGFLPYWITGLDLSSNYFADASVAGTWIKARCGGGMIANNYMVLPAGATGFYLERCVGLVFQAPYIAGGAGSVGINFANAGGNLHEEVSIYGGQIVAATPIQGAANVVRPDFRGIYSNQPNVTHGQSFVSKAASAAVANEAFLDSADLVLKFKDNAGVAHALY